MLDIVGDLLSQALEALIARLAGHLGCELLVELHQLLVLLKVFKLLELGLIDNVPLERLEALVHSLLLLLDLLIVGLSRRKLVDKRALFLARCPVEVLGDHLVKVP